MQTDQSPALLSTAEAAKTLDISEHTLATWRSKKTVNIPFARVGRLVKYRASDLQAFIAANVQDMGVSRG